MSGGSGWVLLTYSPRGGRLVSQWAVDHTHGVGGGAAILGAATLDLDMYENAYHTLRRRRGEVR